MITRDYSFFKKKKKKTKKPKAKEQENSKHNQKHRLNSKEARNSPSFLKFTASPAEAMHPVCLHVFSFGYRGETKILILPFYLFVNNAAH